MWCSYVSELVWSGLTCRSGSGLAALLVGILDARALQTAICNGLTRAQTIQMKLMLPEEHTKCRWHPFWPWPWAGRLQKETFFSG